MNQSQSILNKVTHILLHNFGLKILSIGFALALFIIVRNQQVREFNRTVRVQIKTHRGIIVTGAPERVVNVTLKMPDTLFSRVPTDDELTGEVDLRDERLGKIRVGLSSDNFPNLDKRYSLTMHEPWLDIELDRLEKKRLPVRAVLQGTPKSGFEISKVVVTPPEIELTGPKQALSKLDSISTIPVDITNLGRRDYNAQAGLAIELGGSLKPSIDIVTVKVIFAESPPQQLK
jgi:YbbR domain-containing protein